jgi:hypothetical protein
MSKSHATYDDVSLVLRLYESRREPRLREARAWFSANFRATTLEEVGKLCPPGSEEDASMRMVASHWEMVASFITSGVLNAPLFFESGGEMIVVWTRFEPLVGALRQAFGNDFLLHNLEKVAKQYAEWMNARSPGSYEAFSTAMRTNR